MGSELLGKIVQRVKTVAGVKAFLILPVAALHFAIVAGCVGAYQFVLNAQADSSGLE